MKCLILCFLLFTSTTLLALDMKKCRSSGYYKAAPYGGFIITSSQSTTSTGDCALIGYHSKENKEIYYTQNKDELQLDIARGEGPYLAELSFTYGCSDSAKVNSALMSQYKEIYSSGKPSIMIDSVLNSQNCKHL